MNLLKRLRSARGTLTDLLDTVHWLFEQRRIAKMKCPWWGY